MEQLRHGLTRALSCCFGLRKHRRRLSNGGFSLIETMISLSIFTVGIMAVGAMLVYSTRTRVFNSQLNKATSLAHSHIEDIRKVAIREVDVRYSSVLNFNYILSRDPNYGTIQDFLKPGLLSGSAGYTAAVADLDAKVAGGLITADDREVYIDEIMVLYDDGDMDNHGDETANDGIWSSLVYINIDTEEIKTPVRFTAMTTAEKQKWSWILKRRTILEPVAVNEVAPGDTRRTISHATLNTADVTDTSGADLVQLTVECTWDDMTGTERTISFDTIIARSSM
ncbi:MAG: type II secretion system protein [Deltaproteobacteria bacterium]|nr:type II secretion system protein [Candidatus Zymogenaceae bacterium]